MREGGEPKAGQSTHSDSKSSAVPLVRTGTIHKGGPDCHEEQFGTPWSPINVPQDYEMHLRGFTASEKCHL